MNVNDMIHFPGHIDPQEIYLLERYTSATYLGQLRDSWQDMQEPEVHLLRRTLGLSPPKVTT
ncbi:MULTISPECIES: hypothetical protein [Herbaspirillum]|jgi:hypothetical protein|uniref:hypothetical protein n=1 Tax=Herbaspirillum TaxID=963 RepID=UPI0005C8B8E7|nr:MULTISPECIES: hypothetical protein [Herbaspirillum]NQE50329.1 hypothetical protein [Herbaspirillum rubrisubalbicans]